MLSRKSSSCSNYGLLPYLTCMCLIISQPFLLADLCTKFSKNGRGDDLTGFKNVTGPDSNEL